MKKTKPAAEDGEPKTGDVRLQRASAWALEKNTPRWLMAAASMRARLADSVDDFASLETTEADFDAAITAAR